MCAQNTHVRERMVKIVNMKWRHQYVRAVGSRVLTWTIPFFPTQPTVHTYICTYIYTYHTAEFHHLMVSCETDPCLYVQLDYAHVCSINNINVERFLRWGDDGMYEEEKKVCQGEK